ncbi:reverse transcriptase family protein [Burkholderia multivorans]|uniref:reverse transcriptase family protein n=1 Tax=Burkholderia multivorans TaxID=87883 RepID=UPI001C25CBF7|nr:reverse transcriptase family protein [Burkholderia multivorans]MBU9561562.1 reverse transcriptase family protein [Burkholderia multivorans]
MRFTISLGKVGVYLFSVMRPYYTKKPIGTTAALASALRVSEPVLKHAANNLDRHYTPYLIPKGDGKQRAIVIPSLHLKTIQKRINREIFSHIEYPHYLYGGIDGKDYVRNAWAHKDRHTIIALDVKDFYPSITFERVLGIYQHFLKFSPAVAELLAKLTTFNKRVPQGACTSSHLANLVLHDVEYHVVQYCENAGLTYTRLLDDITVSSPKPLPVQRVSKIIEMISKMLKGKGLRLKKPKTRVSSKSNPESLMEVTGLWLNRGAPRVNSATRRAIRVEVYQCKQAAAISRTSLDYHKKHASASGKVAMLNYLMHAEAGRLRKALADILPLYDVSEMTKTRKIVEMLSRASVADRGKYSFSLSYFKTMQRLNIVARSDAALAHSLRRKLLVCKPTKPSSAALYDEPI